MTRLIIERVLIDLLETKKHYTDKIRDINIEEQIGLCMEGTVWDLKTGYILQIGKNKNIVRALKGFDSVDVGEFDKIEADIENCEYKI